MYKLIVLLSVATFAAGVPLERVKRQNIQGLVIPREFQNINFENYLKNPRAVQFQLKCVIYDGPCDSIGKYLKANLPNWLNTQCKNCNTNQKKQAGKAIAFFQANYPKEWNDAVKKYRGSFTEEDVQRFESQLGIKVEATIPEGGPPKPDNIGLANIAREAINAAKTTEEPIILELRSTAGKALVSSPVTTPIPAATSSTSTTVKVQDETATDSSSPTTGVPTSS